MDLTGVLIFLAIGAVAGWLAGTLLKGGGFGLLGNIIVGVIGAVVGGFLFGLLGMAAGGLLGSIVTATVGAVGCCFWSDCSRKPKAADPPSDPRSGAGRRPRTGFPRAGAHPASPVPPWPGCWFWPSLPAPPDRVGLRFQPVQRRGCRVVPVASKNTRPTVRPYGSGSAILILA